MVGTEAIGSQTRQHSSLDVQAVSCYTEEKQSQEGEGDEKDTLCVSRHYLQKPLKSPVISRFFRFEGSAILMSKMYLLFVMKYVL